MSLKARPKVQLPQTEEQVIHQYFKCIDSKDPASIVDLFDYDAVVYEPFSNIKGGLKGRSAIEPFLKVAMMANSNLNRTIQIEKPIRSNKATAIVTFERGDKVKGKFVFEFQNDSAGVKKIKSLRIQFI